jgi:hypothetical protein
MTDIAVCEVPMDLLAPGLTLVLGFLAIWVAIAPPDRTLSKGIWIAVFEVLTLIALCGRYLT